MYLSTSAVLDALLPWQPNSPTSIKCLRPGAGTILLDFFFSPTLLSFSDIVPIQQTSQCCFISLISHTVTNKVYWDGEL